MKAVQQAARQFASNGLDEAAIFSALRKQFPDAPFMTIGAAASSAADTCGCPAPQPVAPPPPEPKQHGAPLGPGSVKTPKKTRDRYTWIAPRKEQGSVLLPAEDREHRTLVSADLAGLPDIFNGESGWRKTSWGKVEVSAPLTTFDLRVMMAFFQELQACGAFSTTLTSNGYRTECYAIESSGFRIYGNTTPGQYGGSGLRRVMASLERMKNTIIKVVPDVGDPYESRLIESYEKVSAPSGKRLLIRLGHGLSTRMFAKGGHKGTKPIELDAWRDLRGRSTKAYLWLDHICYLHNAGSITIAEAVKRLNIKGSGPKQRHQVTQIAAMLNGRACSRDRGNKLEPRVLAVEVQHNKIVFKAQPVPAQKAA